eukprot:3792458-Prymnesium_polylepis.1
MPRALLLSRNVLTKHVAASSNPSRETQPRTHRAPAMSGRGGGGRELALAAPGATVRRRTTTFRASPSPPSAASLAAAASSACQAQRGAVDLRVVECRGCRAIEL